MNVPLPTLNDRDRRNRRHGWLIIVTGLMAVISGCRRVQTVLPSADTETWRIERGDFVSGIEDVGVVRAVKSSGCNAGTRGLIARIAPEGSTVRKGDPVVWLDNKDILERIESEAIDLKRSQSNYERSLEALSEQRFNLEQALKERRATHEFNRLNVTRAGTELERQRDRFRKQLIPESDLLGTEAELEQLRLKELSSRLALQRAEIEFESRIAGMSMELDVARRKFERSQYTMKILEAQKEAMILYAPADGVVVIKRKWNKEPYKVGDRVWDGVQIVEIPDLSEFRVWTQVVEAHLQKVHKGRPVAIRIPALDHTVLEGVVESISWLAMSRELSRGTIFTSGEDSESGGKVFEVIVSLQSTDERLRNGMNGSVVFVEERIPDVLTVPVSALAEDDRGLYVYVQQNGKFQYRPVKTGARSRMDAVILDGLTEGERVALFNPGIGDPSAMSGRRS